VDETVIESVSTVRKNKISVFLFHLLFSTDIFGLETMLNRFLKHKAEATSVSHYVNVMFGGSSQLPSQMAAGSPTDIFQNSSDVHIGPRHQNNTQVTVNQYVRLIDDVEPLAGNTCQNADTITPHPPEGANRVGKYSCVIGTFV
jgi:hypothetical protein